MKILYAEDNEQARYLLKCLFEAQGYHFETVVNGEEALKRLQEEHFDVIFSDILMPHMDGFSLCYTLKTDAVLKKIRLFFIAQPIHVPRIFVSLCKWVRIIFYANLRSLKNCCWYCNPFWIG